MNKSLLEKIGLTSDEKTLYMTLLEGGIMPARNVAIVSGIGRTLTYKVLDDLILKGLVEKEEPEKGSTKFRAIHPRFLEQLIDKKYKEVDSIKNELTQEMSSLVSLFNLSTGKPNVQFFEGKDGVAKVVRDSYTATTEILTFADNEAMNRYYPELNKENVQTRKNLDIKKRILSVDTPYIRELAKNDDISITERRVLKDIQTFATVLQLYDNKIAYITLDPNRAVGVILEDSALYKMQKEIFESLWTTAEKIY